MKTYAKEDFPASEVRRFLEPGPIILVSTFWRGKANIMTMGWHMLLGFEPSLVGTYIDASEVSHGMARKSRECVINVPTVDLAEIVIGIGNSHGKEVDKFAKFGLTATPAEKVKAPLIGECFASFECRLHDDRMIEERNLFIWEVVKGHAPKAPKYPRTIHYRGQGVFMVSGANTTRWRRLFKDENL